MSWKDVLKRIEPEIISEEIEDTPVYFPKDWSKESEWESEVVVGDEIDRDKCCREARESLGKEWKRIMDEKFPDYPHKELRWDNLDCNEFRQHINDAIETFDDSPRWEPLLIAARKALDDWEKCEGWKETMEGYV